MKRARTLAALLGTAAIMGLPITVVAQDTRDIEFHILLPGVPDLDTYDCLISSPEHGPLLGGRTLELKDNTGAVIGFGVLEGAPPSMEGACETVVRFVEVDDAPVYFLMAGDEALATRARSDLEASDWTAVVALESPVPQTSGGEGAGVEVGGHPLYGQPAPDIVLLTLDQQPVALSSLRGRPVLLNFWASWCGPCREEFALLAEAYEEHQAAGLEILGIVHDDAPESARAFVADFGGTWPMLNDPNDVAWDLYSGIGLPSSFSVDSEGIIQAFSLGALTGDALDRQLDTILTNESNMLHEPSPEVSEAATPYVFYEVQQGDGLLRISELFGVTRNRIRSANDGMRERDASVVPGDLLIVPLGPWLTLEDVQALPGYRGLIAEDG